MTTQHNRKSIALAIAATLAAFSGVQAQAEERSPWQLKTSVVVVDTKEQFSVAKADGGRVYAGGNAGLGTSLAIEYRLSDRLGLEIGGVYAGSPDLDDGVNGSNDELGEGPQTYTLHGGANFRLFQSERVELYAGPRAAWIAVRDFELDIDGLETRYEGENQFTWGATVGLNYRFRNDRISLVAEASFIDLDMELSEKGASNAIKTQHDPLMVSVGLAFSF